MELNSSRLPAVPIGSPATSCKYPNQSRSIKSSRLNANKSVGLCVLLLIFVLLDISVKAVTSAWPVSPTCQWRASWSEGRGWSLWEFCLPPTLCFTATCPSWRTKSGKTCCVSLLLSVFFLICILFPLFISPPDCVYRLLFMCQPHVLASFV